jgi:hypothetical protein
VASRRAALEGYPDRGAKENASGGLRLVVPGGLRAAKAYLDGKARHGALVDHVK